MLAAKAVKNDEFYTQYQNIDHKLSITRNNLQVRLFIVIAIP